MRASTITATLVLAATSTASAFVPTANTFVRTQGQASTKVFAEEKKELVLDTNFDEVNIVRLLGLKSVKRIIRKNKKKAEAQEE